VYNEEQYQPNSSLLHIIIPCLAVPICIALIFLILHLRRRCRASEKHNKSSVVSASDSHNPIELNAMLVKVLTLRVPEYPISSIHFIQDLGGGSFGKVYRGELQRHPHDALPVAIKTMRTNVTDKKRAQFWSEAERASDLRHVNILCVVGVCQKEQPECILYDYAVYGDLHEYLIMHSPNSDITSRDSAGRQQILQHGDMFQLGAQIAAGMDYLSARNVVHGDLAARNVLVADNVTLKISDLGPSRNSYALDYCTVPDGAYGHHGSSLPVRWMPPEAIASLGQQPQRSEADVWSFSVTLWEIYSYGLQPYYGYTNADAIEMICAHEILPSPGECPTQMYSLMVECWHKTPSFRPRFSDIHRRLRQWQNDGSVTGGGGGHTNSSHGSQPSHHSSTGGPSNNTTSTATTSPAAGPANQSGVEELEPGHAFQQNQVNRSRQAYALYANRNPAMADHTNNEHLYANDALHGEQNNYLTPEGNMNGGHKGSIGATQYRPNYYPIQGSRNSNPYVGVVHAQPCHTIISTNPYHSTTVPYHAIPDARHVSIQRYRSSSSPPRSSTSHKSSSVNSSRSPAV